MTKRAEAYLKKYPEPEYLEIEDQEGDPERGRLFSKLTEDEAKYLLRHYGIKEEIIASVFD